MDPFIPLIRTEEFKHFIKKMGKLVSIDDRGFTYKRWGFHCFWVACDTYMVCKALGMSERDAIMYGQAAYFHDPGKLHPEVAHLFAPEYPKWTEEERALGKNHDHLGVKLMEELKLEDLFEREFLDLCKIAQLHHHDWYSLSGGNSIPLLGRILCVVDSYDAMVHNRFYNQVKTRDEARAELICMAGRQFDPEIVDVFLVQVEPYLPEPGNTKEDPVKQEQDKIAASLGQQDDIIVPKPDRRKKKKTGGASKQPKVALPSERRLAPKYMRIV